MQAFLIALVPYIATFFIARFILMFVSVGINVGLITFIYGLLVDLVQEYSSDGFGYVAAAILQIAGVGEFIGILFGAFVTMTIIRRISPA